MRRKTPPAAVSGAAVREELLVLATANAGKLREFRSLLAGLPLRIEPQEVRPRDRGRREIALSRRIRGGGGGSTCTHSECSSGAKLKKTCDACVTDICAEDSYCCNTKWDSQCVSEVSSICGDTCE